MEGLSLSSSTTPSQRAPIQGHCISTQASTSVSSLDQIITVPKTTDIAIVGGGASGLAVAIQLVKQIKGGYKQIVSITLIEKREKIGPGLAYSDASTGLILNMHSDTMGLCHVNACEYSKQRIVLGQDLTQISSAVQPLGQSQFNTFAQAPIPEPILVRPIPHPARR